MKSKEVRCFHCGDNAYVENKGIIFVRSKVDDKWSNVPCCYPCWQVKYRGVKKKDVKQVPFDPVKLLSMLQNTPDDEKLATLISNLPRNIVDLNFIAKCLYKMTKHLNAQSPELVCPEFVKLNELANETDGSVTDPDVRKHRRAVMMHPWSCEHIHCEGLSKFLKDTGMDKLCHPDYGSMNKSISESEEESVEDNR